MAIGKKMLFGALLAACACSVYGATNIVHDAARDLVLNTANKAVYTNFYGGVWSFMPASARSCPASDTMKVPERTGLAPTILVPI